MSDGGDHGNSIVEKRLSHIDAEMSRRDEQIASLASAQARQGEMLNNLASSVGQIGQKLDGALSQMQLMAGRSGRIDLPTVVAMLMLILALWGFAIAPLDAKSSANSEANSQIRSQVEERDRESLKSAESAAETRGYQAARIDRNESDIRDLNHMIGGQP